MTSKELENIVDNVIISNLFNGYKIRSAIFENENWFSVVDIICALCEYQDEIISNKLYTKEDKASKYWNISFNRLKEFGSEISTNCRKLKLPSWKDGKNYPTDCLNRQGLLRLVQEIPTKKAEPFKQWLANVGEERLKEEQNPELTMNRIINKYEKMGRTKEWIQTRLQGQKTRNELTKEWKNRGVLDKQYGVLTDEISKGTFGITTKEHKQIKQLDKKHNLRDNMTDFELIFQNLAETTTRIMVQQENAQGFQENKQVAIKAGESTGITRKLYERKTGIKVVSYENFINNIKQAQLDLPENDKPEDIIAPFTREFKKK